MGPPGVVLACGIKNEWPERLGGRVRLEPAHSCSVGVALVPMMAVGLAALLGLMWLLAALYARTLGRRSVFEEAFVNAAASWAKRSGISAAALREVGVPASVLRRAGLL
jgi:hypothetical protein